MATKEVKTEVKKEEKIVEPEIADCDMLVEIKLPKTKELKDDKWVCINGKSWQIRRGVVVKVPKKVLAQLEHEEEMLELIEAAEEAAQTRVL